MKIMKSMLALFMLLMLLLAVGCGADDKSKGADTSAADKPAATDKKDAGTKNDAAKQAEKIGIKVYYPDDNGMKLVAETRTVETTQDGKYKVAMESLLSGTKAKGVVTIIPKKAKLKSVAVKDGIATVDFSEDLVKNFAGGSTGEEMLVGSIVNTLTEFPEVKSVQILLEGKKVDSLAGHLDTSKPLKRMTELL
ncbi:GerMN domain-containing protein [uncultured Selenomonas sp.]|uniref:GerMN domain-containing protein n=1 Tax=uncultured Selenomonas sp. TaxID=159275 RepID=UPI0028E304A1|nr:GerMN domain-containing protein [uncultured Selenomonas sp.]